jgi:hypothetical protein
MQVEHRCTVVGNPEGWVIGVLAKFFLGGSKYIIVHRCTRVENPGQGVPDVFAKIPWGGL